MRCLKNVDGCGHWDDGIIDSGPHDEGIEYQDYPDANDDEGDAPEIEKV
jgi:hypothetical protein